LLLEQLAPRPTDVALEIGTGSGSSLFRLAPSVAALHSVDISTETIGRLRRFLDARPKVLANVRLLAADFCAPDAPALLPCRYDLIFSCDTLEHVEKPGAFLKNVYRALKPAGRILIAFPNEHPRHAHGITFFERRDTLAGLLQEAGFAPKNFAIHTVRLTARAGRVLDVGWRLPRRLGKKLIRLVRSSRHASPVTPHPNSIPATVPGLSAPQTFDQTDFFAAADRLEPLAPLINAYCWGVMKLMTLMAPVYEVLPAPETIWDQQILIRATREDRGR
jgi:SAM-dependent methyltransferase